MLNRNYLINARNNKTQNSVSIQAGITRQYYCSLESGGKGAKMSLLTAGKLAKALNIDIGDFLKKEEKYMRQAERLMKARKLEEKENQTR
ncbi:MAG: helix-turn-helix transcriptional regulator [Bacteroidaceae bacterium]